MILALGHSAAHVRPRSAVWRLQAQTRKITITDAAGRPTTYDQATVQVGTASSAGFKIKGPQAAADHAVLEQKGKHLFCKPSVRDEDNPIADTHCWLDEQPLRQGVSYVVVSGAKIAFGEPSQAFTVEYTEGAGSDPMADMLVQGWAGAASEEVRQQLKGL